MGKVDTVTKAYMRKNNIFADAFNYLIYEGKTVVEPERLREVDTTEIALPFGPQENGQSNDLVQKYRDILKSAVVMQEDEAAYILLGIENQTGKYPEREEPSRYREEPGRYRKESCGYREESGRCRKTPGGRRETES